MRDTREAVSYYLDRLWAGAWDDAFFGLLDLGPEALPLLIAEASAPKSRPIRAALVEVIWQYRRPEAIDFLGETLNDSDPEVWKQALDGLVALGGPAAKDRLREALVRLSSRGIENGLSAEWLRDALEQIGS